VPLRPEQGERCACEVREADPGDRHGVNVNPSAWTPSTRGSPFGFRTGVGSMFTVHVLARAVSGRTRCSGESGPGTTYVRIGVEPLMRTCCVTPRKRFGSP